MLDLLPKRPSLSQLWAKARLLPYGNRLFSRFLGRFAPYTGTLGAEVLELEDGYARVQVRDRHAIRNHLGSIHAVALMNLGEVATGLAVMHAIDGHGRGIITHLGMDYLKKARGTLTATCRVEVPTEPGTHDVNVTAPVHDAQGNEVARALATWRIDVR